MQKIATKAFNLDKIDRGILLDLQRNCRITLQALADKHGVSANAIRKRIVSLEEQGVIRKYLVELSRAMVNSEIMFSLIYTDKTIDDDRFAEMVFEHPSVNSVHYDSFGTCIVLAEYSGTDEMSEISRYFRRLESVTDLEIHTLPIPRGGSRPLTTIELRILAPLLDNPRMRISEIARISGLTVKRVRKTLDNLIHSDSVLFTISQVLSAADVSFIAFRITWDPKSITPEQIETTLRELFPNDFHRVSYSALEPIMWCYFLLDDNKKSERIITEFRKLPSVVVRNTILVYPPKKTRSIRNQALRKMIEDAGII